MISPVTEADRHLAAVRRYYRSPEAWLGYRLFLGDTKHFGYYRPGDNPWEFDAGMRRMEDLLADRLALPRRARVLDAGCGVGSVAIRLADIHGLDVTGIDILEGSVSTARNRAFKARIADRAQFQVMDYAQLAFPDESFDGAYTMETLVHSDRVEDVLADLYRVLRPGGRLVHFEYSRTPDADLAPATAQILREVNAAAAMPGFQRLTHGTLEQLLLANGFVDVTSEDITDRMVPMLEAFAVILFPLYFAGRLLRRLDMTTNSRSAIEFLRHRESWRYRVYTCHKP